MSFQAFIEATERNQWLIHGVEVYQDGALVHQYGDPMEHRYPIYSATKTITSIAAGMAADEGKLDISQSVLSWLPKKSSDRMSAEQRRIYQGITLKRLMTMSVAGYPFRPEGESWLDSSLQCPLRQPETPQFDYSNVSAYLVGVAVSCAVGENLYQYLNRKLFAPLGIQNPPCGRCPEGYFYGASQMELTVNELSRIGLLLANGGIYGGERIVSEAYVKEATALQQRNREGGYGYFIWKHRDGFSINGKWGQKCYVLPSKGIMVTCLAHVERDSSVLKQCIEQEMLA